MDFKKTITRLVLCLVLSPIVFGIAKLAGANYEISHGDSFIVWVLMAILINLSITNKSQ